MRTETLQARLHGTVITALEPGHAGECDALVWNGRKPTRRAKIIVRAASADDVAEAVRFARENDLCVSPRGGGHQFSGVSTQADMVIDLGALDALKLDPEARTARVEPAVTNARMAAALERHGLAFPLGHCGSVPMSGYLLGGGVGWNSAEWGFACFSVTAVEVVLADGRRVTASVAEMTFVEPMVMRDLLLSKRDFGGNLSQPERVTDAISLPGAWRVGYDAEAGVHRVSIDGLVARVPSDGEAKSATN